MAPPSPTPFYSLLGKATWNPATQARLPDDAFMVIEPGGTRDASNRTTPRSLRHLPILDQDGALDLPHLRNAIAQIPKAGPWLEEKARTKLLSKAQRMLERALETTHKAAADVPDWALGFLAHADVHQALGLEQDAIVKAWRGDAMIAKRAGDWAKTYKAKPARGGKIPPATEAVLRRKVAAHNGGAAGPERRTKLGVLKAVYARGADAAASAGRPMVKSPVQWGMARVNAFLRLLSIGAPHSPGYVGDFDLLPAAHPNSPKAKTAAAAPASAPAQQAVDVAEDADELPEDAAESRTFQGIPLVIDRPKGFVQRGTAQDGTAWERTYLTDYGYVPSTLGGDGDELDVFVGPAEAAPTAYWFVQVKPDGSFDEYKVMLGFEDAEAARACYLEHIPERFLGRAFETPVGALHALLGLAPAELQKTTAGTPAAVEDAARAAAGLESDDPAIARLRAAIASLDAARSAVSKASVDQELRVDDRSRRRRPEDDAAADRERWIHAHAAVADEHTEASPGEEPALAPPSAAIEISKAAPAFVAIGKDASGAPREERYVLGPVLIPDRVDLQGDIYDAETIRAAAFRWMRDYQNTSRQHTEDPEAAIGFRDEGMTNDKIAPVESYCLLFDLTINGVTLPAGTWMLGAIIVDDTMWIDVQQGRITGWSIGGLAKRVPIETPALPVAA